MVAAGPARDQRVSVLLIVTLLGAFAVFGARPTIIYRALDLGASNAEIGLIAAAFGFLALLGAVPVGRLADRFGGRNVFVAGTLLATLTLVVLSLADSLVLLGIGHATLGLSQLMLAIGTQTVISNLTPSSGRDQLIGTYSVINSLGHAIGPIMAGLILGSVAAPQSSQLVFLLGAGAAVIAGGVAAVSAAYPGARSGAGRGAKQSSIGETLGRPGMKQAILGSVVLLTAVDLLLAYLPVYGESRGIPPQTIGLAIGVLSLSQIPTRLVLQPLIARFGYVRILVASMAAPAVLVLALLLPIGDVALIAVMGLIGLNLGMGQPMSLILVALSSPADGRGLAMSLRQTGNRLGQFVVPAVFGATVGQLGVGPIFVAVAVLLGVGSVAVRAGGPGPPPSPDVERIEPVPAVDRAI